MDAYREIRKLIDQSTSSVREGAQMVGAAGEAMSAIVGQITRLGDVVSTMAAEAEEQRRHVTEINIAINHVDGLTQQNAALVEQAAAAAQSLHEQSVSLRALVDKFTLARALAMQA